MAPGDESRALAAGILIQLQTVRDVAAVAAHEAALARAETRDPGAARLAVAVEHLSIALSGAAHLQEQGLPLGAPLARPLAHPLARWPWWRRLWWAVRPW